MSGVGIGYALRLARRELRGGIAGLRVLVACLVLGVAAIAGIGSLAAALDAGIAGGARELLGGDVEAQLAYRRAGPAELAFLEASGRLSEIAQMRAMARSTDARRRSLIELTAVDTLYPLYGGLRLSPTQNLASALAARGGVFGAVVDPALLGRLGVGLGGTIRIGEAALQIRATIEREPDAAASGLVFGPRVVIAAAALGSTRLIRPGALVTYRYRLRLPAAETPAAWIAKARAAFPDAGWQLRSFDQASPELRRLIERVALFLSLVGLSALLVGGLGIGNAVASHLAGRTRTIATLACLGAPRRLVVAVYFSEIAAVAALAIVTALALGALVPALAAPFLAHLLAVTARPGIYPKALALAALYGVLTSFAFASWPLAAAGRVPPAQLFRDTVDRRRPPSRGALATSGLGAAGLATAIVAGSPDHRMALWFVGGAAVAFALFWAVGAAILFAAGRLPRPGRPLLRLALANLCRPGAPTRPVILSLGIGLSVLVAVALVEGNLGREIDQRLPAAAPAFFFIDIQPSELAGFSATVHAMPGAHMDAVPMLRGRITRLNGVPVETAPVAPEARWALRSDRGLTYSAALPKGSQLAAGGWWPEDYRGPPLVSFDAALARGMGLKIGDTLSVNLLGREITARIANLRAIDWERLGINFTLVFSPGTLEAAPQTMLAAVYLPPPEEEALVARVTERFPNVSAIHVREALAAVRRVISLIGAAVRLAALVTLAAGVLVLGGAIAAGHRRRVYDAVVLKVLGATRGAMLASFLIEYGLLGAIAGLAAGGFGTLSAYLLVTRLMRVQWAFLPWPVAQTLLLAVALALVVGFAGTWRALGVKAAPYLRNE